MDKYVRELRTVKKSSDDGDKLLFLADLTPTWSEFPKPKKPY